MGRYAQLPWCLAVALSAAVILAPVAHATAQGGCSARTPTDQPGQHSGTADSLVPDAPSSVELCRYGGLNDEPGLSLEGDRALAAAATAKLAADLNALPATSPGVTSCPYDDGSAVTATFGYDNAPPVQATVHLEGCRGADNGTAFRSAATADALLSQLRAATGAWSPPTTALQAPQTLDPPSLLALAGGRVLVTSNYHAGGYPTACKYGGDPKGIMSVVAGDNSALVRRTSAEIVRGPVPLSGGRVALATTFRGCRTHGAEGLPLARLSLRSGQPDHALASQPALVTARAEDNVSVLTGHVPGDFALSWSTPHSMVDVWRLIVHRRHGPALSMTLPNYPYVALGPSGDALVAWQSPMAGRTAVFVRYALPGRPFGPAVRLGPARSRTIIGMALGDRGQAVVAWGSQTAGEEADSPWIVRAVTRARVGDRFTRPVLLDGGGSRKLYPYGGVHAAITGDQARVVWAATSHSKHPIRFARLALAGRIRSSELLRADATLDDVAFERDGTIAVLYTGASPLDQQLYAMTVAPDGMPSPGELLGTGLSAGASLALAPDGGVIAAWPTEGGPLVGPPKPPYTIQLSRRG
jgi:hypothetical protein